jgi:hypothetical protein
MPATKAIDHHMILALFHILFVAPLFFVIAFFRSEMPVWAFRTLFVLGLFILVYHGYKFFLKLSQNSMSAWINAIHILLFAPLLIYIGLEQKETPRAAYELCIMVGFAALGYHLYNLTHMLHVVHTD